MKWVIDINVQSIPTKLLDEIRKESWLRQRFLERTQKAGIIKTVINYTLSKVVNISAFQRCC